MSVFTVRPSFRWALLGCALVLVSGCAGDDLGDKAGLSGPRPTAGFIGIPYATWSDSEPAYRLYPGDVLDISAPSAPELARTVTVQPDGRVSLPLIAPVMAANRSVVEVEALLSEAYATQLLRPRIDVAVRQATSLKVFVGGEVKTPGVFDMPGDINTLQAVLLAGGFLPTARRQEVVVIRRGLDGRPMMRTVDVRSAIYHPSADDVVPLRRFDIVYVPRSPIAEVDQFVDQYLRQTLPIQFSYAIGGQYIAAP